jgi:hypothetical protein
MARRFFTLTAALAGLAFAASVPRPAHAAGSDAAAFAAGGAFCLEIGDHKGEMFQHLKLVTTPAASPEAQNVITVHGVERGNWMDGNTLNVYFNQLSGTGTVAPAAMPGARGDKLFISLAGSGNGYAKDGKPELWTLQYTLELDPATLEGSFFGISAQSGAVADGAAYSEQAKTFTLRKIAPMKCGEF